MRRTHIGTALGLGSVFLLSTAPMGCATTGSMLGDSGVGVLVGGATGYAIGGKKGAAIGAVIGGLAGAINADLIKSRRASEAETRIAEQRRADALAKAQKQTGDE